MSQFPPPPPDSGSDFTPGYASAPVAPAKWSLAAIAGFVSSLLGCTGIGALLGLVFGIVGILNTRGGRRRGMGLAIAAIPISLLTGLLSVLIIGAGFIGFGMMNVITTLPEAFPATADDTAAAAESFRGLASDDFNASVSSEQLEAWFGAVLEQHGRLTAVVPAPTGNAAAGQFVMDTDAKFINGTTRLRVWFTMGADLEFVIDDIEVDGSSPRKFQPE